VHEADPPVVQVDGACQEVEPRVGAYRRGLRLVRYPADRLIER
jgi:hypothetical protein